VGGVESLEIYYHGVQKIMMETEMSRLYIEKGILRVNDGCLAVWDKLEDRVKKCIELNGEYGHRIKGEYRCMSVPKEPCPLYFKGCNRKHYFYGVTRK